MAHLSGGAFDGCCWAHVVPLRVHVSASGHRTVRLHVGHAVGDAGGVVHGGAGIEIRDVNAGRIGTGERRVENADGLLE